MYWVYDDEIPEKIAPHIAKLVPGIRSYIDDFLVARHPYRAGHVCPFVKSSIAEKGIVLTFIDSTEVKVVAMHLRDRLLEYMKFKTTYPNARTSMIVILPPDTPDDTLVIAQRKMKQEAIRNDVMVGALFPNSDAPSLHSDDYFPLRTPSPTLVFRDIVPMDLVFLTQERHGLHEKREFLRSYIKHFADDDSQRTKNFVSEAKIRYEQYGRLARLRFLMLGGTTAALLSSMIYAF